VQTGCFSYSSPNAGLNAIPAVKITLGTPFPGVLAGNDPWAYSVLAYSLSQMFSKIQGHVSHFIFLRESRLWLGSSRESEMLRCENSTLAIIYPLLVINGIDITILRAGLPKCSKEISCSPNLVMMRDEHSTLAATRIS